MPRILTDHDLGGAPRTSIAGQKNAVLEFDLVVERLEGPDIAVRQHQHDAPGIAEALAATAYGLAAAIPASIGYNRIGAAYARLGQTMASFVEERALALLSRPAEVVRDEGPGFDPATLPDPTDPAQLERTTGRGLLLIRAYMDEVAFNGAGNQITLTKRRTPPANAYDM